MNARRIVPIVCYIWSFAMIVGASTFKGDLKPEAFETDLLVGAIAWLGLLVDKGSPFAIFVGVSMLFGPFVGAVVSKDFKNPDAGLLAIIGTGLSASYVVHGSYWHIGAILGGIAAPIAAALFLTGFGMKQAQDAIIKANGGETSDEKRWRMEKERREEEERARKRRVS